MVGLSNLHPGPANSSSSPVHFSERGQKREVRRQRSEVSRQGQQTLRTPARSFCVQQARASFSSSEKTQALGEDYLRDLHEALVKTLVGERIRLLRACVGGQSLARLAEASQEHFRDYLSDL